MTISTLILGGFFVSAQLVSLDTRDMDLSDFFRLMAKMANMNVVLHPAVEGKINLMVQDAPWEQVMDLVMKNHGLAKEVEGNTMRIVPAPTTEAGMNALPLQTRIYFLKNAKADDIALIISRFLSPRGSVVAYTPLNAVIIRDVAPPAQSLR
jgi:type IV pilus assembly protein PilQ